MPYFMVKITTRDGDIRQPIVTNSKDEEDACELVKYLTDNSDEVEAKPVTLSPDAARKTFGDIPLNRGVICWDWAWTADGEGDEIEVLAN